MNRLVYIAAITLAVAGCGGDSNAGGDAGPVADGAVGGDAGETNECAAGNATFSGTAVLSIELTLSDSDWSAMITEAENSPEYDGPPKVYYRAQLSIDGAAMGEVGLRLKGHYSLLTALAHSFPLKIDPDRFVDGQRIDGLKKLNLHPDGDNKGVLREHLSYGALRQLGSPTARTAFARVTVNGEALGLYNAIEQINGRFIRCHFTEPYGDLYKPEEAVGSLAYLGSTIDDYPVINHKWPDQTDHAAVLAMLDTINHGTLAQMADVLDVDGVLTYLAGNVAMGNFDYYASFGHNYYLYERTPGTFTLLPWDMNFSQFGLWHPCGPGRNTSAFPLTHRLLGDATHVSRYKDLLGDMLSGAGSAQALEARLDAALLLVGADVTPELVQELRDSITFRIDNITQRLTGLDICPEDTDT